MLRGSAIIVAIAAVAIVGASCYPNAPEDAAEFDVVVTFRDTEVNFAQFAEFVIPVDTIVEITVEGAEKRNIQHKYDADIVKLVSDSFEARGYRLQSDLDQVQPDSTMVVLIAAAASTEYDPYQSEPWFSFWGQIFSDSLDVGTNVNWGLDYSWYTGSVVYSYDVGALLVAVIDWRDSDNLQDGDDLPVLWLGTFNGILSGSDVAIVRRVEEAIRQMFTQSPYLSKNPQ
jgi:hypothetical protein